MVKIKHNVCTKTCSENRKLAILELGVRYCIVTGHKLQVHTEDPFLFRAESLEVISNIASKNFVLHCAEIGEKNKILSVSAWNVKYLV